MGRADAMNRPTIVFDLDGTLVDSAHDLVATLNVVLGREGHEPLPMEQARTMIGQGARALLERGLAATGTSVDPVRLEALYEGFLAHYAENIAVETRAFPGVVETIDRLAEEGWLIACCTNKLEWLSRRLLDQLGLASRFAAIAGGDTFEMKKPDPGHIVATIREAGGDPRLAVMVGDSANDIDAAKAAGIPVVAVDFGYTDTPVTELGPDIVISHFDALYDAATTLTSARA